MKAFIYTGGCLNAENITERPKKGDLCIAADSGYNNALSLGASVDILLGDMDSIKEPPKKEEKSNLNFLHRSLVTLADKYNDRYVSDHYPIYSEIVF